MKYIVYESLCLVTQKRYRGAVTRNTWESNPRYFGSGTLLASEINKYGTENFQRRILFETDELSEADAVERALVDREWVGRDDTYNLKPGGGSFGTVVRNAAKPRTDKWVQAMSSNFFQKDKDLTCEYCGKGPMNRLLYGRWHGENCREGK